MKPARRLIYRCIESLVNPQSAGNVRRSFDLLDAKETLGQAQALLDLSERFFGLDALGADIEGSQMHQMLLAAYDKLFAAATI